MDSTFSSNLTYVLNSTTLSIQERIEKIQISRYVFKIKKIQNSKLVRFLITQNIYFSYIFLKMIYDPYKKDSAKTLH